MRSDLVGFFWEDTVRSKGGRVARARPMPLIPETGWLPPTHFPNLSAARALSIDVETYDPELGKTKTEPAKGPGWARHKGHLVGVAVGTNDGYRQYFPMRHEVEPHHNLNPAHVLAWLRDTLSDPRQPKVGANITYDVGWLAEEGVPVLGDLYDVQFAEALLNENDTVNLDDLALRWLGEHKTSQMLYEWCSQFYGGKANEKQRANIYRTPPRLVGPYAEGDVDLPFRVLERQWPHLISQGLFTVFEMECGLIPLMIAIRFAGVRVDLDVAEQLRDRMWDERRELQKLLDAVVGFAVDVWSADSLARAFDAQGIPYGRTDTGKPSFTAPFLKTVQHPMAQMVRDIRERDKLRTVFLESYILKSNVNGRLYCQFHQLRGDDDGTRSGRYSAATPNLTNIPTRTVLGALMRLPFVPDLGHECWRKHDYSQIEYRALAHYAVGPGADELRARYRNDPATDYHDLLQALINERTGQTLKRPDVKTTNFGLVFGMGVPALSKRLGMSLKAGKEFFAVYHEGAPFIKPTMEQASAEAARLGYITTILGRRSRFDLWENADWNEGDYSPAVRYETAIRVWPRVRRAYLHKALNRRLQGTGTGDLPKMGLYKCYKAGIFDVTGVPRLIVHDELDFSDPGGEEDAFREMRRIMETAIPEFSVPVYMGDERGPNWGAVHDVE